MDDSLEYIKMCKQAKEIQERLNPIAKYGTATALSWKEVSCEKGDYISVNGDKYCSGIYLYGCNGFQYSQHYHNRDEYCWQVNNGNTTDYIDSNASIVWLPRQDQLQNMLDLVSKKDNDKCIDLWALNKFNSFASDNWKIYVSMEQLWLAFVISEKYSKEWSETKKDWISK